MYTKDTDTLFGQLETQTGQGFRKQITGNSGDLEKYKVTAVFVGDVDVHVVQHGQQCCDVDTFAKDASSSFHFYVMVSLFVSVLVCV